MSKQKKYHFIYKTTCTLTNKFYVGMHSTDILADGYLGSGKILGYSLAKHGRENHKIEILEYLPSREALKLREKEVVNEELLADPLNMNLKYGGEGGWMKGIGVNIQEQKVDTKARAANGVRTRQQRMQDPEYAAAYGKKISEANKGKQTFLGRKHSEETKAKMRLARQRRKLGK